MDNEARVEIAKLRTRLFILEKRVEVLIKPSNPKENPMAEPKKTEAELLETLKEKMDASPVSKSPPTVGHRPPFSGDLTVIGHCAKTAYDEIGAKRYTSETLHTHLAQGYGEAAVLGLEDGPTPVGAAAGLPGWLMLFVQLIALIGQKQ